MSTKEERQKKYRQSDGFIIPKKVGNATGGKEAAYGDIQERNLPIHRDWHDEEIDFREKSVGYTEIRNTISHMRSRMRESRTSGSVEERNLQKVRLLDLGTKNMNKHLDGVERWRI